LYNRSKTIHGYYVIFVIVGIPTATVFTEVPIYVGTEAKIDSLIAACPLPERVSWQKSFDSVTFEAIDMDDPRYYGSKLDPTNPVLIFRKVSFDDKLYYRLLVWNKIGECISNTVYINVTGGMYAVITVS
jgi:hypothetical protein